MPFQKGNKYGNRFNVDNQPANPGHPKGQKNRGTVTRKIFDMVGVLPEKIYESLKQIHPQLDKSMSIEEIIDIVQAHKAMVEKDTQAAKYLKDNVYGAPKGETFDPNNTTIIKIEIK